MENNEVEDFREVDGEFARPPLTQEDNINRLRKSINILKNINKNSYESSLFFELAKNPIDEFASQNSENEENERIKNGVYTDRVHIKPSDKVCRICLSNEEENTNNEENPLFAPWVCSGTMKYVHLECLQQWVHNKRHTKELEKVKSYNWKFLECELCKHKIHEEFEFKGRKYYLLQYERPTSGKYLILESLTNTPHKTIHVIQIPERLVKPNKSVLVKVGREEKVDVRITDVSVSKYHWKIFYYNGEFYWIDKNSKFGTTVLLRNPISIPQREDNMIRLQVGKHLIELESQSHIDMWFRNSTCRINKSTTLILQIKFYLQLFIIDFKGTEYKDFKQVIPRDMRRKLDMLQNVTNIIETLNVEEAEDWLNREMTKLKLVNESQISQRHLTIENGISIEEWDKEYQNFVLTRKQNQQTTPISYVEVR